MNKFVIVPDATCDLSKELQERFKIDRIVETEVACPDGKTVKVNDLWPIDQAKFYQDLKQGKQFKTASPSPELFKEVFLEYVKQGYDVLSVSISSGLSATFGYAKAAAKELNEQNLPGKVVCFDTLRYSTAELLLLVYASKYRDEGLDVYKTAEKLEELKLHLHQAGPMDDLMYLAKAKRLSKGKAVMGTIVGVNPIGEIGEDGKTSVICKVKGSKKALEVCCEYMKRTIENPEDQIVIIANSNRKEKAELYANMIKEKINPREIIITDVGFACAPNLGPGLCASYYLGKKLSKDLVEETAIFADITNKKA